MTISPLMVELFSQLIRWTCNSSKLTSRTFLLRGRLGRLSPGHECVWSRSSVKEERHEKSKALLIYHFKYILFVSSWKFSLFLEFYWLLPSICLLHDAAFCRRVGWWSCVMVTVLLKKEIGNDVSFSSIFLGSKCQDARAYFKSSEGICCLCALLVSIRKAQVQPTVTVWVTIPHCLIQKHIIVNTLFASITPTSENEVIYGIKCGNYTMGAYLTF